jgi:ferredoxin
MAREITIDRDVCMGSGQCIMYAASTFDIDADGIAIVVNPEGDSELDVQRAVQGCPTQAIRVTDA